MHAASIQWCCAPHLCYHLKRRCFVASYVQPIIQKYESTTYAIKVTAMKITDDFHYEWKSSCAYHKIDTVCGDWDTKEGPGKSMKNALNLQWYSKRHFLGLSDVTQKKKSNP